MRWRFFLVPLLLGVASAAWAGQFVAGTEDVPLMPGLTSVAGSTLVFDKPQGRIVETEAQGEVSRVKVLAFYAASLPQLGWRKIDAMQWRRGHERLTLDLQGKDGELTVGFTLLP